MSKLDEILSYAVAAIDLNIPSAEQDLERYKQEIKDLFLELMDETPDDPNWYGRLRKKVGEL